MYVWSRLASAKWRDAWEERLYAYDARNLVIKEIVGRKSIRMEIYCQQKSEAVKLQQHFGGSFRKLQNKNWAQLTPLPHPSLIKIRDRFLITSGTSSRYLKKLKNQYPLRQVIAIPQDMAFGTGNHRTTATCLRYLVDSEKEFAGHPWSLLDLGTGSGILALTAKYLGAKKVVGVDSDLHAIRIAKKNAAFHKLRITFQQKDVLAWNPKETYTCITANLFSDILTQIFPKIYRALTPTGRLIISGILKKQSKDCLAHARKAGFAFDLIADRGKWVTAKGKKIS